MKKTIFIALLAVVILITAVCLTACRDDRNTGGIYIPPKDDLPSPDDYEKYPEGQPDDGKQDDTGEDLPEIVIDDGIVCGGIEFVIYSTASREIFAEARAIQLRTTRKRPIGHCRKRIGKRCRRVLFDQTQQG